MEGLKENNPFEKCLCTFQDMQVNPAQPGVMTPFPYIVLYMILLIYFKITGIPLSSMTVCLNELHVTCLRKK